MTSNIDALERLSRLRAEGAISEAEFETLKAKLIDDGASPTESVNSDVPKTWGERWATGRQQSSGVRRFFRWFFGLQALAIVGVGIYILLKVQSDGKNENVIPVETPSAVESAKMVGETVEIANPAAQSPSAEYMKLCVFAMLVPTGWSLSEFAAVVSKDGLAPLAWEPSGQDWIMRVRWHNELNDAYIDAAFKLVRQPRAQAQQSLDCSQGGQDLIISAVSANDETFSGPEVTPLIQTLFGPQIYQDQRAKAAAAKAAAPPDGAVESSSPAPAENIDLNPDSEVRQDEAVEPQ